MKVKTADLRRELEATETEMEKVDESTVQRGDHEKFRYYVPTGVMEKFINMVGSGGNFISLFSAANGIGKTQGGANILANLMWPSENEFFRAPLYKNWPYPKVGRIISDPTTIEQTLIPMLHEFFPQGHYKTSKAGKRYEYTWETDTGWRFDIMSNEQEVKEFEAATLGFCWIDEPTPQAIFKATVARMRMGGIIFMTMTPLAHAAWVYDHIIADPDPDLVKGQRAFIEADIESACKFHGVRGFLEHEDIEKMVAEYDEDEKWARAFGKFLHLTGLVFKKFTREIHVIKPFHVNDRDYVVAERLDPHPRNPDAVSWVAIDKDGRHFVVDELYGNFSTGELAEKIKAKGDRFRIISRKADPSAFIVDKHTGKSLASTLLAEYGIAYEPASKTRSYADRLIKDYLNFTMSGDEMLRSPLIYFFETCTRHIWEWEHYRWGEWKGKTMEERDPKEKPVDKDDHMVENVGRVVVDGLRWSPKPRETITHKKIKDDPYD